MHFTILCVEDFSHKLNAIKNVQNKVVTTGFHLIESNGWPNVEKSKSDHIF